MNYIFLIIPLIGVVRSIYFLILIFRGVSISKYEKRRRKFKLIIGEKV